MITASRPPSVHSMATTESGDPLAILLRPPATESDVDRAARLMREAEAKRISDSIDEELKQERERYKKSKQDVKLLLLGQAESGKSTLQKQFQLMYNPTSLEDERLSWRIVIFYNIVKPVLRILDALEVYGDGEDEDDMASEKVSGSPESRMRFGPPPSSPSPSPDSHDGHLLDNPVSSLSASNSENQVATLRLRLSPLTSVESSLANRLSGGIAVSGSGKGSVYVRSGWQARGLGFSLGKSRDRRKGRFSFSGGRGSIDKSRDDRDDVSITHSIVEEKDQLAEEVASVLSSCKDDVKELWSLPAVKRLRDKRKVRLEEWAEYFFKSIDRVSSTGYVPTTDDILHARIQTMGVAEHVFDVPLHGRNVTWHLFDVGGARGQRHTWVPYFDDATAIIFMAPVSAFDQYLAEDPRTNRVDDSLQLFRQICSNRLLKNAHLVLFLNKTDVLREKLGKGTRVSKYITSYGDRPNEFEPVVNYFVAHFTQVHTRNNENNRVLYTHLTSVVDTKATQSIITNVRDSIFRDYLKSAALV
ncbi:Guanine nucleotide-binding protein alpha-4 subunit [Sparassis crispa]|uniref:Guanine nucleotide-binding protein alpha-4 subunit n=1 Tax=Sparassis crispa TaxID=139825 RepID=A0A401H1P8_9APHY|nr:Guanine nucleotide-binding protein alpha-4 subunit [Sparassis crispa]GBE88344.1 Guanine nucleotide-binding protein alpha-4 subunit [Sparassis crispa]